MCWPLSSARPSHGRRVRARPPSCGAISNSVTAWPRAVACDGGGQAGPAAADHGDARAAHHVSARASCVRIAIQSLRSGVNDDALVQHLEAVGLDLAQQRAVDVGHHQAGLLRAAVGLRQQRQRLVVAAVRALGLEAHQRVKRSL